MTEGGNIAEETVTSVDGSVDTATLARGLALLEIKTFERAPRRVDAYAVEGEGKFLLGPKFKLFSLREQHYAEPPDFELILLRAPRLWFNIMMAALFAALGLAPT